MSGLTQRKKASAEDSLASISNGIDQQQQSQQPQSTSPTGSISNVAEEFQRQVDEDGYTRQDMDGKNVKLTLLEEVLLLGLKDEQGYLSFWNDNISYVLRGCILMELAMRGRIGSFKEFAGRHHRKTYAERLIEVVDERPTGEQLLDEALKLMRAEQQGAPSAGAKTSSGRSINSTSATAAGGGNSGARHSVIEWVDLLSGETWNLMKISYQLKQVRERLAKGLVDKGVLRTDKKNFLIFEMATHPVADPSVKLEVVMRVVNCLLGRGPQPTRRTIALCCAAYAANVIELSYAQKDACFAKCEELLVEWSGVQAFEQMARTLSGELSSPPPSAAGKQSHDKERIGWNDILSGVIGVYLKMDSML